MDVKNALAKSTGTKLITHNKNVSFCAVYIAKYYLKISDKELLEFIRVNGLLHDIAKILKKFQDMLNNNYNSFKNKFRHNEIGGAFIYKYLDIKNLNILNFNNNTINYISDSVYWHHGISNKQHNDFIDDVLSTVTEDELNDLMNFVMEVLDESFIIKDLRNGNVRTPKYYGENEEFNAKMGIIRACIICADQTVSMLEEKYMKNNIELVLNDNNIYETIGVELDKILKCKNTETITNTNINYEPSDRLTTQLSMVHQLALTNIFNAPAGFGKSFVSLYVTHYYQNRNKVIYVVPRNVIAESLYQTILNELKAVGLENVTVELYLSGNVVKSNHESNEDFSSDIIITNIDNFLSATVNDSIINDSMGKRLLLLYGATVVFDEYHEFVSDGAYFACFVNIMQGRHQYTQSQTILMSASPVDISYLWDGMVKTNILPEKYKHFPASHAQKYLFNVTDELNVNNKNDNDGSSIYFFNSIFESQYFKYHHPDALLFHSKIKKDVKDQILNKIMNDYGKENHLNAKGCVVSTPIGRPALNISFNELNDSCCSPESSIHSVGRCGRFGDLVNEGVVNIVKVRDRNFEANFSRGEDAVIDIHYEKKLSDLWFNEMKQYDGQRLNLDELYVIYNDHCKKYEKERRNYFSRRYRESLMFLSDLYPRKFNTSRKSNIRTAGGNKLRSIGNEYFFTCPYYGDEMRYVETPFSDRIYKSFKDDCDEKGNMESRMKGAMRAIMSNKDNVNYDYSELLENKKYSVDDYRIFARKENTPYIRFDLVYHPELYLISKKKLEKMLNK